ncbi:MAG: hypothetical protein EOP07_05615 [Proteobacteria bacterium]|nr:MAG: hypothetical protein EOP07_05615 [Pseudomonadota bacterium]
MDKILDFLDFSSIDPQMYWRIASQDGSKTYEIFWRRDTTIHWRFREFGSIFWTLSTAERIIADLRNEGLDMELFEHAIKNSLLHQVCFADRIVKDSRALLGADLVNAGIQDHEEFLKNIGSLVERVNPKDSSPQLRIVKD